MIEVRKFGYGNTKWIGPICTVLGLPLAWYFYHLSQTGEVFNYFHMYYEGQSATYAWWVMSSLMGLVFLLGVHRTIEQFSSGEKYVEITANEITTPRMVFLTPTTYNFRDITSVTELNLGGTKRHIRFKTRYGNGMLSLKAFDHIDDYFTVLVLLKERASGTIEPN